MYGLLLQGIEHFIKEEYGETTWNDIRRLSNIDQYSFSTHVVYDEDVLPRLADVAAQCVGINRDEMLTKFGHYFIEFVSKYGYDRVLRVLGRNMRDFLNGLDNLHEYMRFSYHKIVPPSFIVERENRRGLTLHYRSSRKYPGFIHYLCGQIQAVGQTFYKVEVKIDIASEDYSSDWMHVKLLLHFNNAAFVTLRQVSEHDLWINSLCPSELEIHELFPFHITFDSNLIIQSAGVSLARILPGLPGRELQRVFALERPLIGFTWSEILEHTNVSFQLQCLESLERETPSPTTAVTNATPINSYCQKRGKENFSMKFTGQMVYVTEWKLILYIAVPQLQNTEELAASGIYIRDLHDNIRNLILAGAQRPTALHQALNAEFEKTNQLEESLRALDEEKNRSDQLLYQMLPRQVAEMLHKGEPAINTCRIFDSVTMLVSDIVGFTSMCTKISALQVVEVLNAMYSAFDELCIHQNVYKVKTIGDGYLIVSGAPDVVVPDSAHAEHIVSVAFEMLDAARLIVNPATHENSTTPDTSHLRIRIGIHSGPCAAGVVGIRMPRYCIFGNTLNKAFLMESTSKPMAIQVSDTTKILLESAGERLWCFTKANVNNTETSWLITKSN